MPDREHYDLIVRNATLIDGTQAPRYHGEIGVRNGRIAKLGALGDAHADIEVDASGLIAAPGFIDAHTHDDRLLLSDPDVIPKLSQGVTTVVTGNCGISLAHSPAPHGTVTPPLDLLDSEGPWFRFPSFRAYREELESRPAAINAACLAGHTTFRVAAVGRLDRAATPAEITRMREMARESLAAGAIGISTGTAYPPAAKPHPRLWGTFPRVLGHYSRDLGSFPLETAVYKMTGLTAKTYGLRERGVLQQGA